MKIKVFLAGITAWLRAAFLAAGRPQFDLMKYTNAQHVRMDALGVEGIKVKLVEIHQAMAGLQAKADAEGRLLSADEQTLWNQYQTEFAAYDADLERRLRVEAQAARLAAPIGSRTGGTNAPQAGVQSGQDSRGSFVVGDDVRGALGEAGKAGFAHFGQFAAAVRAACLPGRGGVVDQRLSVMAAQPSPVGTEGVGEDGGFPIPPDFRSEILLKVMDEDQLLSRTDQLQVSGNAITVPTDETTPWESSAGVQAYWEGENMQLPGSKPKFQNSSWRLNKLTALVNVTDELLEDAPALDGYLRRKAPQKINFKINRAIVGGNGVGQPLGIINSPATVTVAAEGGQSADTLVFNNITKMWARMYSQSWNRAVWLANQDTMTQLMGMQFPGTGTAVPVFIPPGGLADSPFGRLMGRPIIFTEACETIGDKGDLLLVDLTQYMTALKAGGIRLDTSMHLYFDYNATAFRFIIRVAGAPWWSAPITPRASSTSLSCFVALAAR